MSYTVSSPTEHAIDEMCDLPDFEKSQSVGARLVGASVTKTVDLFNVSRATVYAIMAAYITHSKTLSANIENSSNENSTAGPPKSKCSGVSCNYDIFDD